MEQFLLYLSHDSNQWPSTLVHWMAETDSWNNLGHLVYALRKVVGALPPSSNGLTLLWVHLDETLPLTNLISKWADLFIGQARVTTQSIYICVLINKILDTVAESVKHRLLLGKVGSLNPIQVKSVPCHYLVWHTTLQGYHKDRLPQCQDNETAWNIRS